MRGLFTVSVSKEGVTVEKASETLRKHSKRKQDGRHVSVNRILNVAGTEYVKWLFNPRMIVFVVMYLFLYDYVIAEMLNGLEKMGGGLLNLFEPFIAMANNALINLIIPSVFLVLISDFPKTDGNTMFYMQRTGKLNWLLGQMVFAGTAALTYLFGIIYLSLIIIAPKAYPANAWSDLTTDYAKLFPEEELSRLANLINARLYNNVTPAMAFVHTFLLLFLFLMLIAAVLMTGFAMGKRTLFMGGLCLAIAVGSGLCRTKGRTKWFFPSANSLVEMRFDEIFKRQEMHIGSSYLYFLAVSVLLLVISCIVIRRYDFSKVTDMED